MSAEKLEGNFLSINHKNITNEINQLQIKLEVIVQPYTRPISSILPEERQVETSLIFDDIEIDAHYDKFSTWDGSISKKAIKDWLKQFETILDQNIAHLLLTKFQFLSKSALEAATSILQNKLLDFLIEQEKLRELFNSISNPTKKSDENFRRWLRNKVIRYASFPSPPNTSMESQYNLWATYERSALTGTSSPDGKKIRPLKEYFEANSGSEETSVFVLMDYTNGSGNQLSKCIKEIHDLLSVYPQYKDSIFIFMYIVQSEFFSLDKIEFAPPNSQTIFYDKMLYYKSSEIMKILACYQINEAEYDNFIEKYCLRSSGKADAGYYQSGSLTCYHYSCPNNTLPFFHKPNRTTNWIPLFRNSQTPSATRYKRK